MPYSDRKSDHHKEPSCFSINRMDMHIRTSDFLSHLLPVFTSTSPVLLHNFFPLLQATPRMQGFLDRILIRNPPERATADELLQHPFLRQAGPPACLLPLLGALRKCPPDSSARWAASTVLVLPFSRASSLSGSIQSKGCMSCALFSSREPKDLLGRPTTFYIPLEEGVSFWQFPVEPLMFSSPF